MKREMKWLLQIAEPNCTFDRIINSWWVMYRLIDALHGWLTYTYIFILPCAKWQYIINRIRWEKRNNTTSAIKLDEDFSKVELPVPVTWLAVIGENLLPLTRPHPTWSSRKSYPAQEKDLAHLLLRCCLHQLLCVHQYHFQSGRHASELQLDQRLRSDLFHPLDDCYRNSFSHHFLHSKPQPYHEGTALDFDA